MIDIIIWIYLKRKGNSKNEQNSKSNKVLQISAWFKEESIAHCY